MLLEVVEEEHFEQAIRALIDRVVQQLNEFPQPRSVLCLDDRIEEHIDTQALEAR